MKNIDRCDSCGKFATRQKAALYTLWNVVQPSHPLEEAVAVCEKCSEMFTKNPALCKEWLDERLKNDSK